MYEKKLREDLTPKEPETLDNVPQTKSQKARSVFLSLLTTAIIFVIVFVVSRYIFGITIVNGHSMENTLHDQDRLLMLKVGGLERYDIVVFEKDGKDYIKRIIGLPGEKVLISGDNVFINGKFLNTEVFGNEKMKDAGLAAKEIVLGYDEYFVLGDNRNNSSDSRLPIIGNVNRNQIIGKVLFRLWPDLGRVYI